MFNKFIPKSFRSTSYKRNKKKYLMLRMHQLQSLRFLLSYFQTRLHSPRIRSSNCEIEHRQMKQEPTKIK